MNKGSKLSKATRRAVRIRKKILSVSDRPRLTVFRSNKFFYAQIVDDKKGVTLVASNDSKERKSADNKITSAVFVGKSIAEKAKAKKINEVVFDKGAYKYHGRVKAFADSARENGLIF